MIQIGDFLYDRNPLFTVCGYICGICERDCNYKTKGGAIKRRLLKQFLSDTLHTLFEREETTRCAKG